MSPRQNPTVQDLPLSTTMSRGLPDSLRRSQTFKDGLRRCQEISLTVSDSARHSKTRTKVPRGFLENLRRSHTIPRQFTTVPKGLPDSLRRCQTLLKVYDGAKRSLRQSSTVPIGLPDSLWRFKHSQKSTTVPRGLPERLLPTVLATPRKSIRVTRGLTDIL
ncbi:hypothetical protein DPMN_191559 [Dreissena polymorpha]|uniref:Uncharacterized protein n=1 Tax=Dreissena polymorpha TaxID=45954 RepID=A0A9D3Y5M4_DREPO|nr:hypothetical protein DPMN_191559 [Dreissena polymorpha]